VSPSCAAPASVSDSLAIVNGPPVYREAEVPGYTIASAIIDALGVGRVSCFVSYSLGCGEADPPCRTPAIGLAACL
jgi:hypothetical protein